MSKIQSMLLLVALGTVGVAHAQAPTGTITGVVTDATGAVVAGARITITNRATGLSRNLTTSAEGDYSAVALPPGDYQVTAEAMGFSVLERTATVEAGTTTTVNLQVQIGITENITVSSVTPLIHYDGHQVGGLVSRNQIENLPLNGRNFLDLAKLEPGVTNATPSTNNRVFVPVLGTGVFVAPRIGNTRVTVDGANIVTIGNLSAILQISQEVVQEFQLSTVNFDLSTSLTTNGAINIVTRSGGNEFHGSGFYFYRDHTLAADPGLQRDPNNPDPFFQRSQFGYHLGGPIARDHAFFFTSYERNDQRGVFSVQPRTSEFAPLGGVFPSPFLGNQFNVRFDVRLNQDHNAFIRYTHDGNSLFGPNEGNSNTLPSAWSRVKNWVDQSIGGITSVLSPGLVNDLRFSYFFVSTGETPATAEDCPGCLGVGVPRINIADAEVSFGQARGFSFVGRRYQLTESLAWQRGNHSLRFGFDWEHAATSTQLITNEPATIQLYSPEEVRRFNTTAAPSAQIPLPSSFSTLDDILRLSLRSLLTGIGPGLTPQRDFRKRRHLDLYRLYAADTWRIDSRLTVNYGLAWSYEPNSLNTDLSKPKLLTAILGPDGLGPPVAQKDNFSPTVGFAWAATRDGKTVIRGGAGRYFDPVSFNGLNLERERLALSPAGTGRRTNISGTGIFLDGRALDFQSPTAFTGADLQNILPGIRAKLLQQRNPDNRDFTFRNLDLDKAGSNLYDPLYEAPYALHLNVGVQREIARDLVLSADFAWRRFLHTFLGGIDYNHFNRRINGVRTPVIPSCTPTQRNDLAAICSAGQITFDNTTGIAQYKGLLVRVEKRFSRRTQFLVSYALGSFKGSNGPGNQEPGTGFNNDDWFENYGPLATDLRHVLNLSGFVDLPWRFQVSFNLSAYSRPPFSAFVSGVDFNGDGSVNDLLPGTRVNQFNRGRDRDDLAQLVDSYNQEFAGKQTLGGQPAPRVTLPADYTFNDSFFTQDLRISRTFPLGRERVSLMVLGEVFNFLNTANLVGYSGNIGNSAEFGQPGARFSQVFGSGGPRAFQLGARVSF
ncbi:MAG: carboxypeptidase regulatory-like domain-containing protein [Acidobacteriota bacterium]